MIIANPIYDAVFKRLMENASIARGLLSRILGEEIVRLEMRPQELTNVERRPITFYRVDFSAVVQMEDGTRKNVLIEVQKAKLPTDLIRFRNYLGTHYQRVEENTQTRKEPLPIVSIYFLNFCLDKSFPKVIQVARGYRDAITGEAIEGSHEFIECLTHDAYLVQVPLLDENTGSGLERALSVFDQKYALEGDPHRLNLRVTTVGEDELLGEMIRELEKAAADPKLNAYFDFEDEMLYGEREFKRRVAEAEKRVRAQERRSKKLEQRARDQERRAEEEERRADEQRQRADEEKSRADEERMRADEERMRADRLAEKLKKLGIDPDED